MNIFVGNLAPNVTEEQLIEAFKVFGQVKSAEVKRELFTGVSKGFGFVEMPGRAHSIAAINALNGNPSRNRTGNARHPSRDQRQARQAQRRGCRRSHCPVSR